MTIAIRYDEKELLLQVAAGNEAAFTRLFHHWHPFLATHIYRITESVPITEEIVQDVFLKIWEARKTLAEVRNFRSYLLVASKNHALNALQKIAREFRYKEKYWKENQAEPVENPDGMSVYYSLVDEAIDKLSSRQKEVYLLHYHGRFTCKEIAERLGIGRESVKTHLGLAVAAISKHVNLKLAHAIIVVLAMN